MLQLAQLFSNGAVLQRRKDMPVWGWTEGACKLKATIADRTIYGISSLHGEFIMRFPAMEAGGPYTLTVENLETGETASVDDVLIGEVWLCSGQSNMQYTLDADWGNTPGLHTNREQEAEFRQLAGKQTTLRYFTVAMSTSGVPETTLAIENPRNQPAGKWLCLDERDYGKCTAVGAWFGLKLWQTLGIPVGVINSSYGGTVVEAWTSRAALLENPDTAGLARMADTRFLNEDLWNNPICPPLDSSGIDFKLFCDTDFPDDGKRGILEGWQKPDCPETGWKDFKVPGSWIMQGFGGNGAVWIRTDILVPQSWEGKAAILHLGGMDKHDITFFNGVEIGRTGTDLDETFWCVPRTYQIPANLMKAGRATIAIRVFSFAFDGGPNGTSYNYFLEQPETGERINVAGVWKARREFTSARQMQGMASASGRGYPNTPGILFDTMINPLLPYSMRGVIWYQGCSNADSIPQANSYEGKMISLLKDWRYRFEQPNLPLIQVQLAAFRTPKTYSATEIWPFLRDSQRTACEKIDGMYMVTALDVGEELDIHPQDKKTPGTRLADCALAKVYHSPKATPLAPLYRRFEVEGNAIRLYFDCEDDLELRGNPADSFFVGNAECVFRPADSVTIENHTLLVSSKAVKQPASVRYAWADNPTCVLFNKAGVAAPSFRTDAWPQ